MLLKEISGCSHGNRDKINAIPNHQLISQDEDNLHSFNPYSSSISMHHSFS